MSTIARYSKCALAFLLSVLVATDAVQARMIRMWSYDDLFREADVVIIGKVSSVQAHAGNCPEELKDLPVIAERIAFEVRSTLKGKEYQAIDLINYRLAPKVLIVNGPGFIVFRRDSTITALGSGKFIDKGNVTNGPPDYLMFLKRNRDGSYRPVSGHYDTKYSFRELSFALPVDATN